MILPDAFDTVGTDYGLCGCLASSADYHGIQVLLEELLGMDNTVGDVFCLGVVYVLDHLQGGGT